jgi:hypothetical protein
MTMNGIGTREELRAALLQSRELPIEKVYVPELDLTYGVRVMTGIERDAFESEVYAMRDKRTENLRARLVVRCVCDMEGKLLFEPSEATPIGMNSWIALDRLASVAQRLNMMSDAAMEDLKGKSVPSLGDEPSSASH